MNGKFISILVILTLYITNIYATFAIKTVKMICNENPKLLENVTCKLHPINRYKAIFDMDADIVGEFRNITLVLEILAKNYANRFIPVGVRLEANACAIFGKKSFPVLGKQLRKALALFSNVNHSCPYSGHLRVKGAYFSEQLMGFIMPTSSYKAIFKFSEGFPLVHIGTAELFIDVMEVIEKPKKPKKGSI